MLRPGKELKHDENHNIKLRQDKTATKQRTEITFFKQDQKQKNWSMAVVKRKIQNTTNYFI
jgi:hypothetical protein